MGVHIDTRGVMHDIGLDVTESSAAQAANLLLDVNQSGPPERAGYTTPPPPSQGVPRHRTMQPTYSDLSDDAGADTDLPEPVNKKTPPVLTTAMLQKSNSLLKRVNTERQTDTVRFIIIIIIIIISSTRFTMYDVININTIISSIIRLIPRTHHIV